MELPKLRSGTRKGFAPPAHPPPRPMRLPAALLTAAVLVFAPALRAHPAHTAHADLDFRRGPDRLEITVRAVADDLEAALRADGGPAVSLERTPPDVLAPRLLALVRAGLRVTASDGTAAELRWVGHELDEESGHARVWIHLEAALPGGVEGARVLFRLLQDAFPGQRNTVRVRDGSRETTLAFAPGDPPKVVRLGP